MRRVVSNMRNFIHINPSLCVVLLDSLGVNSVTDAEEAHQKATLW